MENWIVIIFSSHHTVYFWFYSAKFKFYRPPVGTPGITEREIMESLNCLCKPTCFDTVYDTTTHRSLDKNQEVDMIDAYVDIYYGKTSFKYQRYVIFGSTDLLGKHIYLLLSPVYGEWMLIKLFCANLAFQISPCVTFLCLFFIFNIPLITLSHNL